MRRIAVLGTGLIGGSIGLGLCRALPGLDVAGYDRDPSASDRAVARGAVTRAETDAGQAVAGADLVVMAVPLGEFEALLGAIHPFVSPDATVTDVASAKTAVVAAGEGVLGSRFVGGHPMAGSERHGIDAADPDLFVDASWILTPTATTSSAAYASASELATTLGARVVGVGPDEHDALVARLSHVPQLTASALVAAAAGAGDEEALLGLAGGGFRDVTRIAASDPELWISILRTNRTAVLGSLEHLGRALDDAAVMIEDERWNDLRDWLTKARRARLELFAKPVTTGEPVALSIMVPDRPGVLAEVTTAAGKLGANIEDLRIVHSTEGGRGRLELVVAGRTAADDLALALEALGYHVDRPDINFST
ncbi:MAG: prephenate dehydrogenase [Actinomycetota bacterium]|jgi:prephenate dehydrogenase|nr:prephenate dehydrogenase [Actinomycetota bacterium]